VMGSRFDMLDSDELIDIWERGTRASIAAQ